MEYNDYSEIYESETQGWPGDGSGMDDLADYNQNEADDYRDEGLNDSFEDQGDCLGE